MQHLSRDWAEQEAINKPNKLNKEKYKTLEEKSLNHNNKKWNYKKDPLYNFSVTKNKKIKCLKKIKSLLNKMLRKNRSNKN